MADALDIDTIFARGDIVAFREYVKTVRPQELTLLMARADKLRLSNFHDEVVKAMIASEGRAMKRRKRR